MTDKERQLAADLGDFNMPRYQELPQVGLYLKQAADYINQCLAPLGDVTLTSSMISNYVKHGLISRPQKKLYHQDQLAELMFIAVAKNVLQLDNLKLAIQIQHQSYDTQTAYDYFCEELENVIRYVFGLQDQLAVVGHEDTEQKHMLRNLIMTVSHKSYLDKYFQILAVADSETNQTTD